MEQTRQSASPPSPFSRLCLHHVTRRRRRRPLSHPNSDVERTRRNRSRLRSAQKHVGGRIGEISRRASHGAFAMVERRLVADDVRRKRRLRVGRRQSRRRSEHDERHDDRRIRQVHACVPEDANVYDDVTRRRTDLGRAGRYYGADRRRLRDICWRPWIWHSSEYIEYYYV